MHTCAYCCFASLNHEKANGKVVGLVESAVFLRNAMFEKKKEEKSLSGDIVPSLVTFMVLMC